MNDTTRDKLIERIAELADQFACGAAGEPVVYALHGPMDFAEEVIEMVTAARDAEIREALMQPEVVKEAAKEVGALDDRFYDGSAIDAMQCALEAALQAALAAVEPEPGITGTKMTGAYEAMMELSMYVGEEEWDSAQRHIRPASRRVSLRDAQAYTVAAYEKERQAKENGDG